MRQTVRNLYRGRRRPARRRVAFGEKKKKKKDDLPPVLHLALGGPARSWRQGPAARARRLTENHPRLPQAPSRQRLSTLSSSLPMKRGTVESGSSGEGFPISMVGLRRMMDIRRVEFSPSPRANPLHAADQRARQPEIRFGQCLAGTPEDIRRLRQAELRWAIAAGR